jgi:hypothetical protein
LFVCRRREGKWLEMLSRWDSYMMHNYKKVRERCRKVSEKYNIKISSLISRSPPPYLKPSSLISSPPPSSQALLPHLKPSSLIASPPPYLRPSSLISSPPP